MRPQQDAQARTLRRFGFGIVRINARNISLTDSGVVNTSATSGSKATTTRVSSAREAKRLGLALLLVIRGGLVFVPFKREWHSIRPAVQ
jgi:hypothetical protein